MIHQGNSPQHASVSRKRDEELGSRRSSCSIRLEPLELLERLEPMNLTYRITRPGGSDFAYTPISLSTSSTKRVSVHSFTSTLGTFSKIPDW